MERFMDVAAAWLMALIFFLFMSMSFWLYVEPRWIVGVKIHVSSHLAATCEFLTLSCLEHSKYIMPCFLFYHASHFFEENYFDQQWDANNSYLNILLKSVHKSSCFYFFFHHFHITSDSSNRDKKIFVFILRPKFHPLRNRKLILETQFLNYGRWMLYPFFSKSFLTWQPLRKDNAPIEKNLTHGEDWDI